jgi:riboflavin biosynthesis pyrimidine reductase
MCRVAHTFTTGSLSIFRFERDVSYTAVVPLAVESTPSSSLSSENGGDIDGTTTTGVTLKIAFDAQGGVADLSSEKSERFTCGESLDMVHRLRRVSDAVLVGRSTVEIDDCTLTVRRVPLLALGNENSSQQKQKQQPVRVIVDPQLDLKLDQFKIFKDGLATIVVHAVADDIQTSTSQSKQNNEKEMCNVPFVKTTNKDYPNVTFLGLRPISDQGKQRLSTRHICYVLAKEFDIHHIMVEGGPNTALQFLKDGTVDRAILVYAPISFKDPLLSSISTTILDQAGLEPIGKYTLGVDSVKCLSRPNIQWPSNDVSSWP